MSDPGDRKRHRGRSRERGRAQHVSDYVDDPYSFGDSEREESSQSAASQSTPASSRRSSQSRRTPSSSQPRQTRASLQQEIQLVSDRLKELYASRPLSADILSRCDRFHDIENNLKAELAILEASGTQSPPRSPTPPTTSPPRTSARSPTPPPPPQVLRRARSPTRRPPPQSARPGQSPRSDPPPPERSRSRSRGEEESDSQDSSDDDGNETVRQHREVRRAIPVPGADERAEYKRFVKSTSGISNKDVKTAMREFDRVTEINRRQSRNPRLNLSEINRAPNKVT